MITCCGPTSSPMSRDKEYASGTPTSSWRSCRTRPSRTSIPAASISCSARESTGAASDGWPPAPPTTKRWRPSRRRPAVTRPDRQVQNLAQRQDEPAALPGDRGGRDTLAVGREPGGWPGRGRHRRRDASVRARRRRAVAGAVVDRRRALRDRPSRLVRARLPDAPAPGAPVVTMPGRARRGEQAARRPRRTGRALCRRAGTPVPRRRVQARHRCPKPTAGAPSTPPSTPPKPSRSPPPGQTERSPWRSRRMRRGETATDSSSPPCVACRAAACGSSPGDSNVRVRWPLRDIRRHSQARARRYWRGLGMSTPRARAAASGQ